MTQASLGSRRTREGCVKLLEIVLLDLHIVETEVLELIDGKGIVSLLRRRDRHYFCRTCNRSGS